MVLAVGTAVTQTMPKVLGSSGRLPHPIPDLPAFAFVLPTVPIALLRSTSLLESVTRCEISAARSFLERLRQSGEATINVDRCADSATVS